jgi:septum formation protein
MAAAIYLASRSPRRHELLNQIGVNHTVIDVEVDETPHRNEAPAEYVLRMALAKAEAGRRLTGQSARMPVLAADTAVVVDNRILGKPEDREEAIAMLKMLAGRRHKVLTGVALATQDYESRLSVSTVSFRPISDDEARLYWQSGEPADKAGGYGIQGLGALFITRLEGSYSGVMGLPLYETGELLLRAGVRPLNKIEEGTG